MARHRTKNRTHKKGREVAAPPGSEPIPKSFVMRSGKVTKSVMGLVQNLRRVMEPNTASKLKEQRRNRVKDFVQVSGQLGVTHFLIFSQSATGTNLRLCKTPKGPTLIFRVHAYSLMKDILASQIRPRSPGLEYQQAPLLVLNNFKSQEKHMQLMTTMLQNMFPPLCIETMKLTDCRRVVLFHLDPATMRIEMRHYYIHVKAVGVSKSVKRILQAQLPNLHNYQDISDFILREGNVSESEAEDLQGDTVVTMEGNYVGRNNRPTRKQLANHDTQQRSVRLSEIGPRLTLQLIKIEDGFCEGEVLYHQFIKRTPQEVEALRKEKQKQREEKARRRAEQEQNVEKKKQLLEEHKKRCASGQKGIGSDGEEEDEEEIEAEFQDKDDAFDRNQVEHDDDDEDDDDDNESDFEQDAQDGAKENGDEVKTSSFLKKRVSFSTGGASKKFKKRKSKSGQ